MSKKIYDLYGVRCDDINLARSLVESTIDIKMKAHDSSYHCGEYFRSHSLDVEGESFILQKNYDEFDDEWMEDKHRQYDFLFYVNDTQRSAEISFLFESTTEIVLLRHQELKA